MRRYTLNTPSGPLMFTILHRSRVKKRLHLELDDKGGLVVVAPGHWNKRHIIEALAQNTTRVAGFLERANERRVEPLKYNQGEQHLYLGASYPLNLVLSPGKKTVVRFTGHEFQIESHQLIKRTVQVALQQWYRQQAQKVFNERLELVSQKAEWVQNKTIPLKLRRMKRTWGNCSASGVIKLNTHLIKAPIPIIDSVVAHEICHLKEMNHGKAFYALLESLNPDWRRHRAILKSQGHTYLN